MKDNAMLFFVFESSRASLVAWARRRFRASTDAAEDIVQLGLLKAARSGFRGESDRGALALLYRACMHAAIELHRQEKGGTAALLDSLPAPDCAVGLVELDAMLRALPSEVERTMRKLARDFSRGDSYSVPRSTIHRHRQIAREVLCV